MGASDLIASATLAASVSPSAHLPQILGCPGVQKPPGLGVKAYKVVVLSCCTRNPALFPPSADCPKPPVFGHTTKAGATEKRTLKVVSRTLHYHM